MAGPSDKKDLTAAQSGFSMVITFEQPLPFQQSYSNSAIGLSNLSYQKALGQYNGTRATQIDQKLHPVSLSKSSIVSIIKNAVFSTSISALIITILPRKITQINLLNYLTLNTLGIKH